MLALAALLLVAACAGDDDSKAVPSATVPAAPATTATTNPDAIPEVIDAAYVNRVLAGLDAAVGDIVRLVVRTQDIPPEAVERVKAVFLTREGQNLVLAGLSQDIREDFRAYQENPGNKRSTVTELLTATRQCIFAEVNRDYSAVTANRDSTPAVEWVVLKPADRARGPMSYNPTPWAFAVVAVEAPARPC